MAAVVFENGVATWSPDPLVTAEAADAYASARAWADWSSASTEAKAAAILDASTYVRISYTPPATTNSTTDATIAAAVTEAARLTLGGTPLLGGSAAAKPQVSRVRSGSSEVEFATTASANDLSAARLALVAGLLRSAGATRLGGLSVRLAKA